MKKYRYILPLLAAGTLLLSASDTNATSYKDNFYQAVNKIWIESHTIPDDKGMINSFVEIDDMFIKKSQALMASLLKKEAPDAEEQIIIDYYKTFMDMKTRDAKGITALQPKLDKIDALKDKSALADLLVAFNYEGLPTPYAFGAMQDPDDAGRYILMGIQAGMGLQKKFYFDETPAAKTKRDNYTGYLKEVLALAKIEDVNSTVANNMKVERALAKEAYSVIDMQDVKKMNNVQDFKYLDTLLSHFKMPALFDKLGYPKEMKINIATMPYFKALNTRYTELTLKEWQDYLKTQIVSSYAGAMGETFIAAKHRYDVKEGKSITQEPLDVRAIRDISNSPLNFLFGKLYIETYFDEKIKSKVETILNHILDEYRVAISQTDRFGEKTKKAALRKIDHMAFNIAYPEKWHDYSSLKMTKDDYTANALALLRYSIDRDVAKLKKGSVDKEMWEGYAPQQVNAYYSPVENKFVLLAGILNTPFFEMNASDAANYGGIGLAIGHEIGHAFDQRGAQYDEKGNLKNWWIKEDLVHFTKLNEALIAQANAYEIAPGVHANGKLQVGEIQADLSGAEITLRAYLKTLKEGTDTKEKLREFYLQYAKAWKAKARPKILIMLNDADGHPVAEYRINGTVKNMDSFHEAFDVKKGDGMYLSPEKRVQIWTEKK